MRRNKRIDTLVIILADIMLPYYQMWRNDRVKHAKDYIDATQRGYDIWKGSLVDKLDGGEFQVDEITQ